ncbi:hypothetical protein ZHAS_00013587 [Anopheles sinensis]|uniref:Uncharacterized protein n=1 Tax=Anopheles sinensis TaxID=74873 RepID=A0A084W5V4_ANOSI|nr:hypothetical protein ZHAS_00013587 [Anopheles sinensis]
MALRCRCCTRRTRRTCLPTATPWTTERHRDEGDDSEEGTEAKSDLIKCPKE